MIVTCVTPDYEELATRLWRSLSPPSDDIKILPYDDQGSWVANTLMKPVVAERFWVETGRKEPIWLLDADLVYTGLEPLDPLWELLYDADMAVHMHHPEDWRREDQRVSAGVVGFNGTPTGASLFSYWAASCSFWTGDGRVRYPEQYLLSSVVGVAGDILGDVEHIPLKYNARPYSANQRARMYDMKDEEIVLSHVPASREMKKRGS